MKRLWVTVLFLGTLGVVFSAEPAPAQVSVNISIGGFYDELEPYGEWVDCSYGDCWVPERVSADWQPYSNGEWIYTEYGWTWISDDPWGDDPYHYGTWTWTNRYGWVWVPGTVWAPAWVTWVYSDDYVGWAPLPPTVAFGSSGYVGRPIVLASSRYVFVPTTRFVGTNVRTVRVAPQQSAVIFRQATPITRFAVTGGIVRNTALPFDRIQRASRARIETRNIRTAKTAPRPIAGWTRGTRRQVSVIAPAREVRQAISARPQKGSRSTSVVRGNGGGNRGGNRPTETRQQGGPSHVERQPVVRQEAQPKSNAPVYRDRGRDRGRQPEARQQAAPPQAAPAQVQPNPRNLEKQPKGHAKENRGNPEKEKGKGKKDKP